MPSDRMLEYYYAMGQDAVHLEKWDEAVAYFRKAANMGAAEAAAELCAIGRRWETGRGMEKDEEKARLCYEVSAGYGNREACLFLGSSISGGLGRPSQCAEGPEKSGAGLRQRQRGSGGLPRPDVR